MKAKEKAKKLNEVPNLFVTLAQQIHYESAVNGLDMTGITECFNELQETYKANFTNEIQMKKPMFNRVERNIIRESDSLLADRMKLHIAKRKFDREFMKTPLGRLLRYTVNRLNKLLS